MGVQGGVSCGSDTVRKYLEAAIEEAHRAERRLERAQIDSSIGELLASVALQGKQSVLCSELSGGEQRRLSIAAAFAGNPRAVLLDEVRGCCSRFCLLACLCVGAWALLQALLTDLVTVVIVTVCVQPSNGLDTISKHAIWSSLLRMKKDRTIVVVSHFPDEVSLLNAQGAASLMVVVSWRDQSNVGCVAQVEVLADRIAILCDGELRYHGTTLRLKHGDWRGHGASYVPLSWCHSGTVSHAT